MSDLTDNYGCHVCGFMKCTCMVQEKDTPSAPLHSEGEGKLFAELTECSVVISDEGYPYTAAMLVTVRDGLRDEMEKLRGENERYRAVLEEISRQSLEDAKTSSAKAPEYCLNKVMNLGSIARAALSPSST